MRALHKRKLACADMRGLVGDGGVRRNIFTSDEIFPSVPPEEPGLPAADPTQRQPLAPWVAGLLFFMSESTIHRLPLLSSDNYTEKGQRSDIAASIFFSSIPMYP